MKRFLTLLIQAAIVLVGLGALAFLLWAPQVDGANARATFFQIYFTDPFVAYVYAASVPFFVGLHRGFSLLGNFRKQGAFSTVTVAALRSIRGCAFWILGAVPGGLAFVLAGEPEPPGIVMCFPVTFASGLVAVGATLAIRAVQRNLAQSETGRE